MRELVQTNAIRSVRIGKRRIIIPKSELERLLANPEVLEEAVVSV